MTLMVPMPTKDEMRTCIAAVIAADKRPEAQRAAEMVRAADAMTSEQIGLLALRLGYEPEQVGFAVIIELYRRYGIVHEQLDLARSHRRKRVLH